MPQVQLFPNTYYHIYNRGNNGETIFIEERNYRYFLQLYRNHITPIAETYAYCLLRNHFHFLIRLKDLQGFENLEGLADGRKNSQPFANFFNAYTKAFNKSYNRTGSLFEGRFKRKPVTDDRYFQALVIYIHQNPEKHGLIDDFRDSIFILSSHHQPKTNPNI